MKKKMGKGEERLRERGWMKRNMIGKPRLSESVDLYRSLGYETHLEPMNPNEMIEECRRCYGKDETIRTIYIRRK